jgi:hypothetical protein
MLIITIWVTLFGGWTSVTTGIQSGWREIILGIILMITPVTPFFRKYIKKDVPRVFFPTAILISNALMVMLSAFSLSFFIKDKYVFYNRLNTLGFILWAGAVILSFACFVANVAALIWEKRQRSI